MAAKFVAPTRETAMSGYRARTITEAAKHALFASIFLATLVAMLFGLGAYETALLDIFGKEAKVTCELVDDAEWEYTFTTEDGQTVSARRHNFAGPGRGERVVYLPRNPHVFRLKGAGWLAQMLALVFSGALIYELARICKSMLRLFRSPTVAQATNGTTAAADADEGGVLATVAPSQAEHSITEAAQTERFLTMPFLDGVLLLLGTWLFTLPCGGPLLPYLCLVELFRPGWDEFHPLFTFVLFLNVLGLSLMGVGICRFWRQVKRSNG